MEKFTLWFSWLVILLYFALGIYVLVSPRFQGMSREIRVIFAVFLFLYGAYRLARLWTKSREKEED